MSEKTMRIRVDEDTVRIVCLELALETWGSKNESSEEVVKRADTYLAFINGEVLEGETA